MQRLDAGELHERRDARVRVLPNEPNDARDLGRHYAVTEPPTRHRVRLREAVEDDRPLAHAVERGDRERPLAVHGARIDLVGDDEHVMPDRDLGDALEIAAREDAAGGIVRRVEDQQLGTAMNLRLELVEIEPEACGLEQPDRNGLRLQIARGARIRRIGRIGEHDLIARIDQRRHDVPHERLEPGADHDVLARVGRDASEARGVLGDRVPQRCDPRRRRVVRLIRLDRGDAGCLHVRGGLEIGFPDLEVDDVDSLRFELACPRKRGEGILGGEPRSGGGKAGGRGSADDRHSVTIRLCV